MTALAPFVIASVLAGLGVYGVIARRNAMLVLVGLELILLAAGIILVTAGALGPDTAASGNVLTLFVITIAAAEVVLALAILVAAYRAQGHVDLERSGDLP
ncbi:NADH-quinone oxidoreductase subunit NuoK [Janibacter sp. YIM B02568]|jgi:NADH-quinone oxidoreductase subunit K|uniref:NADH-quinone oxidoreductase subunit NuoK n=1 Tax=Janibacter endophyticus TaxID=2806261 RepID=UPI00194E6DCA|nr:NADH-quinone oxidoreductase subunit NuoK [Janibacter endophyticus]MBM6545489.1 NADH-quinone oxidoreductase subunit NuoK [Janibacter endophyticus]